MTRFSLYSLLVALCLTEQQLPGQAMITTGAAFFKGNALLVENILWLGYLLTSGLIIFKRSLNYERELFLIRFQHRTAVFWYVISRRFVCVVFCLSANGVALVITGDVSRAVLNGSLQMGLVLCALMLLFSLLTTLKVWKGGGILLSYVLISWLLQADEGGRHHLFYIAFYVLILLLLSWIQLLRRDILSK